MKLLKSDIAIITILSLLLFSLVRFQESGTHAGSASAEARTPAPVLATQLD
jgi:hypothetical protein